MNKNNAGKGSSPRNCFSKKFKDNYEDINWTNTPKQSREKTKTAKNRFAK